MPIASTQFISPFSLSALDGLIGATFNGAGNAYSSYSVARAGDVNGDGIDDVLIGSSGASAEGATYLIFGHTDAWSSLLRLSSLNGTNGVVISGVAGQSSSRSVASAGDMNGDGIGDLIISASNAAYLIFGHTGTWSSPLPLSSLNGINGVVINGTATNSGSSVAGAGDVNGDGISDLLIGASAASLGNLSYAGYSCLIFGYTGAWSNPFLLSSLNGTNGVVINGIAAYDFSGSSVASAGDVNGDGIRDLLIGAFGASTYMGSTYLIFGHTGTWSSPFLLSSLNGINGVVINGVAAYGYSGFSVAGAGDVNGDGISDIVIGAYVSSPGGMTNAGSTYLIFGHTGTWNSTIVLSSLNGTSGVVINGIAAGDCSGISVTGAGDVNGDGFDDVLIGAFSATPGNLYQAGSTYLIFGHNGTWSTLLVLSSLNGNNGVIINGIAANDQSGNSVAGVGDVNGDGFSDVLIGAFGGHAYLIFGDSCDNLGLLINTLAINQGQTVFLNNSMLAAYRPHNPTMNANISFSITNVTHGVFSTFNFPQSALSEQLVSFTHDGSIYAPSYDLTVGNFAIVGPAAATINFGVLPILYLNPFSIGQGQTVVLTNQTIRATSLYFPAAALMFSVNNVTHGNFIRANTTTIENQFNQSLLILGEIAFVADGSTNAPSYDISVSNGKATTLAIPGIIHFNTAPILLNNQLTLVPGQERVILSSNDLSASDTVIPAEELTFTPSTLNCHFENTNLPGIALPLFLQKNVQGNQIVLVWDGYIPPAYNMSVSDGALSTHGPASITITSVSNITNTVSTETTNTNAIIGGVAAMGAIGLLFFGLQRYLKKRTNKQLQRILLEGTSNAEKAFNIDVVRPIANKIFEVINTTGFLGQRSEADTKAYTMAIGKIVSELRRRNANLDFNTMEPNDKESFISEIANQARQQSLPKYKGFSFGSCTRFFKAKATPQEIEYVAEGIALASVTWQNRHMSLVSANSKSLSIELEKFSNREFPEETANDSIASEKSVVWMQNRMKVMRQQEQEHQEELKRLERQVAQGEVELAALRLQGSMALQT